VTRLREADMRKAQGLGKVAAPTVINVVRQLYSLPTVGVADIVKWTGFSRPGAYKVINRLIELDILKPRDEAGTYGQKYVYDRYVSLFTADDD